MNVLSVWVATLFTPISIVKVEGLTSEHREGENSNHKAVNRKQGQGFHNVCVCSTSSFPIIYHVCVSPLLSLLIICVRVYLTSDLSNTISWPCAVSAGGGTLLLGSVTIVLSRLHMINKTVAVTRQWTDFQDSEKEHPQKHLNNLNERNPESTENTV